MIFFEFEWSKQISTGLSLIVFEVQVLEHIPVLLSEVLELSTREGFEPKTMLDATFGRGGHSVALLKKFNGLKILGLDQDHEAINFGENNFKNFLSEERLFLERVNFLNSDVWSPIGNKITKGEGFDIILVDLGVSSPQLDKAERGFSFYHDGPLDMRMDHQTDFSAKDIVNTWDEDSLIQLFHTLGEVRRPQRVVKRILQRRNEKDFETTLELASLIAATEGWRKKGHHPATQYFMALRLEVNGELKVIEQSIKNFIEHLSPQGRLLVISFHSLEDRLVKYTLRDLLDLGKLVNKKVVQPKWEEQKKNPRSRSAKLRVFEKKGKDEQIVLK